jgi:benzodiazapine receptor
LIEIGLLWSVAGACGYAFWKVNKTAGYLFIPYMGWLTLATASLEKIFIKLYLDNIPMMNV